MAKHTDTSHVAASARRARARNMRLIKVCIVVIVVSVAFVAGLLIGLLGSALAMRRYLKV